jgi:drug/metabolite transporter (DMT)-like permease
MGDDSGTDARAGIMSPMNASSPPPVVDPPVAPPRPMLQAFAWMTASGAAICGLNSLMKSVSVDLDPMQAQFLRSLFGLVAMLPFILPAIARSGPGVLRPQSLSGQVWRGVAHTGALSLFFISLPHLPLSDATALGFTTPIWVMLGAALLLRERVSLERWGAAVVGFAGMLIVIAPHWEQGTGSLFWSFVMLCSSPLFAASALITKSLTRFERPATIVVWQGLTVSVLSLPFALAVWQAPTLRHWLLLATCGVLGSIGHYCMTRAFTLANVSAMQPVRFLDMVWAGFYGVLLFGELPGMHALGGGALIVSATVWIARREARATPA